MNLSVASPELKATSPSPGSFQCYHPWQSPWPPGNCIWLCWRSIFLLDTRFKVLGELNAKLISHRELTPNGPSAGTAKRTTPKKHVEGWSGPPFGIKSIGTSALPYMSQMSSAREKMGIPFWLIGFKREPFPQKRKTGHHWATGI